jgi:CBS domain containing-hemolysin-like protein
MGEPAFAHVLSPSRGRRHHVGGDHPQRVRRGRFLFITFLHILIGELVPKAYAIRATEQVALWTALPMRAFQVTVKPALWFLDRTATLVLRWLRVDFKHGTEAHSEEELRMLLAESHRVGTLSGDKRELLENIIDYTEHTARTR